MHCQEYNYFVNEGLLEWVMDLRGNEGLLSHKDQMMLNRGRYFTTKQNYILKCSTGLYMISFNIKCI